MKQHNALRDVSDDDENLMHYVCSARTREHPFAARVACLSDESKVVGQLFGAVGHGAQVGAEVLDGVESARPGLQHVKRLRSC